MGETLSVTIQMKAIEQYVVLFVLLHTVVLTFESMDETIKCNHSNETIEQYGVVLTIKVKT